MLLSLRRSSGVSKYAFILSNTHRLAFSSSSKSYPCNVLWGKLNDSQIDSHPSQFASTFLQFAAEDSARTVPGLSSLFVRLQAILGNFCTGDLTNVILSCKRLRVQDRELWLALCSRAEKSSDLKPHDIGIMLSAFTQAGHFTDTVIQKLLTLALENVDKLGASVIAHIFTALSQLDPTKFKVSELIQKLCEEAHSRPESFDPIDIALTLQAMTQLGIRDMALVARLSEELTHRGSSTFSGNAISATLKALVKFDVHDMFVIEKLCDEACKSSTSFTAQGVAITLAALSSMGTLHKGLMNKLRLQALRRIDEFTPDLISMTFTALSTLQQKDRSLIRALSHQAVTQINDFNSRDISNTLISLVKFGKDLGPEVDLLVSHLCEQIPRKISSFNARDVSNCFHAQAALTASPETVRVLSKHALALDANFSPQEICHTLDAMLVLKNPHKPLVAKMCQQAANQLGDFNAKQITTLLRAIAQSPVREAKNLLPLLDPEIVKKAESFTTNGLCNSVQALAQIDVDSSLACVRCLFDTASRRVTFFNSRDVGILCQSLLHLKFRHLELTVDLCKHAYANLSDFSVYDIISVLSAMVKFQIANSKLVLKLYDLSFAKAESFTLHQIVLLFDAFRFLDTPDRKLVIRLCEVAIPQLARREQHTKDISGLLGALARQGVNDRIVIDLIARLCQHASSRVREFTAADVARTIGALGKFNINDQELIPKLLDQAIYIKAKSFDMSDLMALFESMVAFENRDPEVLARLAKLTLTLVHSGSALELASILKSISWLDPTNFELIHALCDAGNTKIPQFNAVAISKALQALSKLNLEAQHKQQVSAFIRNLCDAALHQLHGFGKGRSGANLLLALVALGIKDMPLINGLCVSLLNNPHSFNPQTIANILRALERSGVYHQALIQRLCQETLTCLHDFKPIDVCTVLEMLSKLKYLDETVYRKLCEFAIQKLGSFSIEERSKILATLALLREKDRSILLRLCRSLDSEDLDASNLPAVCSCLLSLAKLRVRGTGTLLLRLFRIIDRHIELLQPDSIGLVVAATTKTNSLLTMMPLELLSSAKHVPSALVVTPSLTDPSSTSSLDIKRLNKYIVQLTHRVFTHATTQIDKFNLQSIELVLHTLVKAKARYNRSNLVRELRKQLLVLTPEHDDAQSLVSILHSLLDLHHYDEAFYLETKKVVENSLNKLPSETKALIEQCNSVVSSKHLAWPLMASETAP